MYLSIVEGFREGGTIRQKTVEPVGYLDELESTYDDPIAHFEARAAELTAEKDARVAPVALTIVRLVQLGIRERRADNSAPCAAQILGDLSQLAATKLESNWWVFDHHTELTDETFSAFDLEVPTRYMPLTDIRQLGAKKNAWKGISNL